MIFFSDEARHEVHLSSGRVSEGLGIVQTGLNSADMKSTIRLISLVLNNIQLKDVILFGTPLHNGKRSDKHVKMGWHWCL